MPVGTAGGRRSDVCSTDGTRLSVYTFGPDDGPPMILVHGFGAGSGIWREQIRDLGREFRVITYDQRGHGASDVPQRHNYGLAAGADDLNAVLHATLRPGERAVIAGHSLGGSTVMAWAGRHRESAETSAAALVLINTCAGRFMKTFKVAWVQRLWSAVMPAFADATMRPLTAASVAQLTGWIFNSRPLMRLINLIADPALVAAGEVYAAAPPRGMARQARAIISEIGWQRIGLEDISVPVLVVAGRRDRILARDHADWIARVAPNNIGLVQVDSGHLSILSRPAEVNAQLRALCEAEQLRRRCCVGEVEASVERDS
ncbi:alpha/beta hydrolase [Mycobacterium sp. 94-17]|uniref:alpha/beta fold hydrolase n=1 Tax=Mycobacterium sp. 94-17 TaxID=2986147 RepID=UPI002D1F119F|nr:alpha/beta hydrolase [Mycobacterium sp. 94-17]MEB4209563.1 alpha/beta hydrolase [Mycobacterium sp. 94-17]